MDRNKGQECSGEKPKKGKTKKLSIDILLFTISSFGTRFLSFFLVPFYTNFLSTEEYGTIDLLVNTASLFLPIFTLCIYESVMRFTIEDKKNSEYFKAGWSVSLMGAVILAVGLVIFHLVVPNLISGASLIWIWMLFACNAVYNIFTSYMRATDRVSVMVEASLFNSVILLSMNIWLIAYVKIGINGYFISTVTGLVVASLYMALRILLSKRHLKMDSAQSAEEPNADTSSPTSYQTNERHTWLAFGVSANKSIISDMFKYCVPLIFTAIAWWINSSLDRYFVSGMMGVSANGIYSVSYKIPNILTAFQTVFTQAWSISAVTAFDKDDKDGFMGHTYEMFAMLMIMACSGIMLINEPLSRILYAKEFYEATYYVPYILIATLFSALAGYFGGIFAAVKDSKTCAASTIISATVNMVLNAVFIPLFGIAGAAVATMISYFCSWIVRAVVARKYIKMKADTKKLYLAFILLLGQMVCAAMENHHYVVQAVIVVALVLIFRKNIAEAWKKIFGQVKKVVKRN